MQQSSPKHAPQRIPTKLGSVGLRGETIPMFGAAPPARTIPAIDFEKLLKLTSTAQVIVYARTLPSPPFERKEVFTELGIDKGTWSKIEDGTASLPVDKLQLFNETVGNKALTLWLAHKDEFDARAMRLLMDDKDRIIAEQAARIAQMEHDHEIEKRALADFVKKVQQ